MNQRQKLLVRMLYDADDWLTGRELSTRLQVSDRTIRSDIIEIRRLIDDCVIRSSKHYGYRLVHEVIQGLTPVPDLGETSQAIPANDPGLYTLPRILYTGNWINYKDRGMYILHRLLYANSWISITNLGNECFICDSVLENELRKVRRILSDVPGLTLCRRKRCLRLLGGEKDKRALLVKLIWNDSGCDLLNMNSLNHYFTTVNPVKLWGVLEAILTRQDYRIHAADLSGLALYVGIAVQRIMERYIVSSTELTPPDLSQEKDEATEIAAEFFSGLDYFSRKPIPEEVRCLAYFLREGRDLTPGDACGIGTLLEQVLQKVYENYQVDLRTDEILVRMLEHHIASLFSKNWIMNFENPILLQDIKIRFPLVFEISCFLCSFLEQETGRTITEREIGFIALHLQCSYHRMCEPEKYKILLISPYNSELTGYCTQRLYAVLRDRIDSVSCLPFFEETRVRAMQPDVILVTSLLVSTLEIPTLQISILMSEENENSIIRHFGHLDAKRFRTKYLSWMSALVRPEFFFTDLDVDTPEEIIKCLCDKLQDAGCVDALFAKSVLERESLSSTSFELRFAMPHSINHPSHRSVLLVAFLKKPVMWGNYEVSLVMLPAIAEADKGIVRVLFNWLGGIIGDTGQMAALFKSRSWELFIKLFQT